MISMKKTMNQIGLNKEQKIILDRIPQNDK